MGISKHEIENLTSLSTTYGYVEGILLTTYFKSMEIITSVKDMCFQLEHSCMTFFIGLGLKGMTTLSDMIFLVTTFYHLV